MQPSDKVKCDVSEHLHILQVQLCEYFPVPESRYDRISNPFVTADNALLTDLTSKEQDSPIELSCDRHLKLVFTQKHLTDFWLHSRCECPELSDKAVKYLMPDGFFALVALNSKYRNKLDVETDLSLKLLSLQPNIKSPAEKHQPSH
jgi:hypothetical protein